jgi:hypothetical protein
MKKSKRTQTEDLFIDVVEYAFIEWLVRRGLFTAFRSNFLSFRKAKKSFRSCLRDHIRAAYRNPRFGLGSLITTAFLFISSPEGHEFWLKHAEAWRCFYLEFVKHR